jgi:Tol biopolymer transport system component
MPFYRALLLLLVTTLGTALAADDSAQENKFSNTRQLVFEGKRSGEAYFSPDGKKVIFQSEREPANPFYQQYILDLETGETKRVSSGIGKTTCGFFQPGSDRVLFASTQADPEAVGKQKAE